MILHWVSVDLLIFCCSARQPKSGKWRRFALFNKRSEISADKLNSSRWFKHAALQSEVCTALRSRGQKRISKQFRHLGLVASERWLYQTKLHSELNPVVDTSRFRGRYVYQLRRLLAPFLCKAGSNQTDSLGGSEKLFDDYFRPFEGRRKSFVLLWFSCDGPCVFLFPNPNVLAYASLKTTPDLRNLFPGGQFLRCLNGVSLRPFTLPLFKQSTFAQTKTDLSKY